jgi:hypothetical protein
VFYQRMRVPAGSAHIEVRMDDDMRVEGFSHTASFTTELAPEQALVVDFDTESGKFQLL